MIAAREAARELGLQFAGSRVSVQGFGNVGATTAILMHDQGCLIVAVSDVGGGIYAPDGLDPRAVLAHAQQSGQVAGFPGTERVTNAELLELPCDYLVPAALEGQIGRGNASAIKAKVIVEGANGPTTPDADEILAARNIFVVPDILANAGGVVVSYFEWVQDLQAYFWTEAQINAQLERIMVQSFADVVHLAKAKRVDLRVAAMIFAVQRVADALMTRGIYP